MPDKTTHYVVRRTNGRIKTFFRHGPGGMAYYNGAGWVTDGYLMRYFGLGGDADDVTVVPDADVPALMAVMDARYAAADPTTDAKIERLIRYVEDAPVSPDGMRSPEEP